MSILSRLRLFYWRHLSKPAGDRSVYRGICRQRTQKIVELGIADCRRALRIIQLARFVSPEKEIHYIGLDPFEDRGEVDSAGRTGLTLKAAYQLLRASGARVQLLPGNPADSLVRMANALGKVDLLIVPGELVSASYGRVWLFVPRMLHPESLVFAERAAEGGGTALSIVTTAEIEALASAGAGRRAA
ncbi:MAG: hypothetical protein LLG00_08730 [Planctomycetaceae bacterium]|nr:hypothetical protein [Planctomycetaceae bacterium]